MARVTDLLNRVSSLNNLFLKKFAPTGLVLSKKRIVPPWFERKRIGDYPYW